MKSLTTLLPVLLAGAALASPLPSALEKRQSAVPYGTVITSCTVPGTIAIAFDDGPFIYTSQVLDILAANGVPATFFVNGQNYDSIYNYAGVIQRMVSEGHQVASHTWGHADLSTLDYNGIASQMSQLEDALRSIIGKAPTYMRPPYFAYSGDTLSALGSLGYHVITASIDTQDWQYQTPETIGNSVGIFNSLLASGGSITLEHDPLQNTVQTLVQDQINAVRAAGLTPVTVGACLGDPASAWYK
ncbi:polysaccharide deacetylase family protein [Trichodelitschia bisporula]|uniref:Polysaccharide deacetylase family protein n=1 Tax=Trichodelitschia bisporula TaxID=703511 RepID=A0A6G1HRM6_9PEZI|nr:polysaccharide deacetylase family protein [Trichodelitschia bisporula]